MMSWLFPRNVDTITAKFAKIADELKAHEQSSRDAAKKVSDKIAAHNMTLALHAREADRASRTAEKIRALFV